MLNTLFQFSSVCPQLQNINKHDEKVTTPGLGSTSPLHCPLPPISSHLFFSTMFLFFFEDDVASTPHHFSRTLGRRTQSSYFQNLHRSLRSVQPPRCHPFTPILHFMVPFGCPEMSNKELKLRNIG